MHCSFSIKVSCQDQTIFFRSSFFLYIFHGFCEKFHVNFVLILRKEFRGSNFSSLSFLLLSEVLLNVLTLSLAGPSHLIVHSVSELLSDTNTLLCIAPSGFTLFFPTSADPF